MERKLKKRHRASANFDQFEQICVTGALDVEQKVETYLRN